MSETLKVPVDGKNWLHNSSIFHEFSKSSHLRDPRILTSRVMQDIFAWRNQKFGPTIRCATVNWEGFQVLACKIICPSMR